MASLRHPVTMRTMITTEKFSLIGTLKICVALNKEKCIASFRPPVPMRTIRTMITTASFFLDRNAQILYRIKQRKGLCFIQESGDDDDDQDDDMITPKTFILLSPKYNQNSRMPLLKPM